MEWESGGIANFDLEVRARSRARISEQERRILPLFGGDPTTIPARYAFPAFEKSEADPVVVSGDGWHIAFPLVSILRSLPKLAALERQANRA